MNLIVQWDTAVIEHVFQPLVNRFELSPRKIGLAVLTGDPVLQAANALLQFSSGYNSAIHIIFFALCFVLPALFLMEESNAEFPAEVYRSSMFVIARLTCTFILMWLLIFPSFSGTLAALGKECLAVALWFFCCKKPPPRRVTYPVGNLVPANK